MIAVMVLMVAMMVRWICFVDFFWVDGDDDFVGSCWWQWFFMGSLLVVVYGL